MADAGVGEEAFEVGLRDGGEVAEDHGGTGNDREKGEDFFLQGGDDEEGLHDAEQHDEAGGFGGDGEEGSDRSGRALVYVGHPELKRGGGNFETEGDEDEAEAEEEGGRGGLVEDGEFGRDGCEVELSGHAVDPRDPVDKEAGREGAEDEVFGAGFEAVLIAAEVGDEDVEGDGDQFERDEDHHEVDGGGHPHEAGAGEDGEGVELTESGPAAFGGKIGFDRRGVFERHDQHDHRGQEGELFEEEGEGVRAVKFGVGGRGVHRGGVGEESGAEDAEESENTDVGNAAFGPGAGEGFGHEQDDAQDDDGDFEVERVHQGR